MKKILVTGADGFIGSHLVEGLVHRGTSVKAFVYYNSFNSYGWLDTLDQHIRKEIEIVCGDVRDPYCVKKSMQDCSQVYHLASLISIPYSYDAAYSYVDTNVKGTLNVVHNALECGIEKVVHTSTSEVYGTAQYVPITEQHPLNGQSPYAASKIGADQMAYSYHCSFGLPVSIVRPFNTYGPRQSARAIIPTIITQALVGADKIVLGSIFPTRDFTFVKDTVNGFVAAMEAETSVGHVINLGSNFEVTIGDLAQLIIDGVASKAVVVQDERRVRPQASEVERLWASNAKAKKLIGWQPKYEGKEGLKRGIAETIAWFRGKKNLTKYKPLVYNI